MDLTEFQLFTYFVTRTGMFVEDKRTSIYAFFTGYEIGKKSNLSNQLSILLESKYDCPKRAMGWNGQVEMYAEKLKISWKSAFKKSILEVVYQNMTASEGLKIEEFIRLAVISDINQLQPIILENGIVRRSDFNTDWVQQWFGIVDVEQKRFRICWNKEELKIIEEIDAEIIENYKQTENKIINPTNRLIDLSKKLEINRK